MCRIETSIHKCGHASVPIHEFCPQNPSQLLPNERGACPKGYERMVPLIPHICTNCKNILEERDTFEDVEVSAVVGAAQEDGRRDSGRDYVKDEGTQTGEGRRLVFRDEPGMGLAGSVVLPEGVDEIEIAWR